MSNYFANASRAQRIEFLANNFKKLKLMKIFLMDKESPEYKKEWIRIVGIMKKEGLYGKKTLWQRINLDNLIISAGLKLEDPKFANLKSSHGRRPSPNVIVIDRNYRAKIKEKRELRVKYVLEREHLWYGWPFGSAESDVERKKAVYKKIATLLRRAGLYSKKTHLGEIDVDGLIHEARALRRQKMVTSFDVRRQAIL